MSTKHAFHAGERKIHQAFGIEQQMQDIGSRVIRDFMPQQHSDFYQQLPFILLGHVDVRGRPWASMLTGQKNGQFIFAPDNKHLDIEASAIAGDELQYLDVGQRVGMLGIELHTKRRNRLVAELQRDSGWQWAFSVIQSFGNCPKYIQLRELSWIPTTERQPIRKQAIKQLDKASKALIRQADTFFVASYFVDEQQLDLASNGADVSHRGGEPGFVEVADSGLLTIPDYAGNHMFSTLGNIESNGKAGLLFVDFENGHLLSMTGKAWVNWQTPQPEQYPAAERLWHFQPSQGYWLYNALPFRFSRS
ncbi:pyridoxamine 5'-phosphate oxidase family protein [Saccharobesus litoralis]|nr:pyridoxamine 5'-phosphate oxidase family protein [Saccharobesus litoralis]